MTKDIEDHVDRCEACQRTRQSTSEEAPIEQPVAAAPADELAIDLFDFGRDTFMVIVDRFSGWYDIDKLAKLDTAAVTKVLERWTRTYGLPKRIMTDGGPQFRAPFSAWCEERQIDHATSSPYHPRSNGLAEAAVKQAKLLLERVNGERDTFEEHLQVARNTPRAEGPLSPSELFLGRRQRMWGLPIVKELKEASSRQSPRAVQFTPGDRGRAQDVKTKRWDVKGTIIAIDSPPLNIKPFLVT